MTAPVLPWWQQRLLGIDLETTGVNVHDDRIVTASMVYLAGNLRPKARSWVIDPGVPVPEEAAAVHGWTTEKLKAYPEVREPGEALFEMVGSIALAMNRSPGMPLVLANAPFDLSMLEAECARHDVDPLSIRLDRGLRPVVDVMVLDRAVDRYRKGGRKLTQLCTHYGVLLGDAHAAHADALAACRVLGRLAEKYQHIAKSNPDELHELQVDWRAEQMDGLRSYFDRKGTAHDGCCGEWPVHAACAPVGVAS